MSEILELMPYEMCIHQNRLFVFSARNILTGEMGNKFNLFINDTNKLTFHENKMLVPRVIQDKTPGKEFEFQIFEMVLK
ncbi:hypothetical protein [Leptospira interrogans]|nr:hypothetical protein [Leptospira interrogans]MCH5432275.1 hypothetical protein [Leptospira interrogans serovar Canicola]